ncbi:MAG: hypothetical protein EOM24_26805 [Chloroflexia bacterium]|nr:hypothetical protein [Chloroflexia bacterium]
MMFHNPPILPRLAANTLFSEADLYQARFAASLARKGNADLVAGFAAGTMPAIYQQQQGLTPAQIEDVVAYYVRFRRRRGTFNSR